jgi:hypothetical protein
MHKLTGAPLFWRIRWSAKLDTIISFTSFSQLCGHSIALAFDGKRRILKNDILLLPKDQPINGTVKYFEKLKVER